MTLNARHPGVLFFADWVFLLVIATLSFLYFGMPFYPFLDSDLAVHVYMTESFSFGENLYFWHQDRLGSIVPMTGHLLYKLFDLAPVWACAMAEYLYLAAGCYAFWYFIPLRWQRWLFTVLWFFPAFEMTCLLLTAHPYGEQMAFVAFSLVCFDRSLLGYRPEVYIPSFFAFAFLAVWVSDFSVLFYVFLPVFFYKRLRPVFLSLFVPVQWKPLALSLLSIILGAAFIFYAKTHTPKDSMYVDHLLANKEELTHSLSMFWLYTYNVITFNSISLLNSLMFYSASIVAVLILAGKRLGMQVSSWSVYFLVLSVLSIAALCCLRWVAVNYVMLKYFIPAFVLMWAGFFSVRPRHNTSLYTYALFLSIATIMSAAGGLYQHVNNSRIVTGLKEVEAIKTLAPVGFIGDYWYSYLLGIADPSSIATTPHEGQFCRNRELLGKVLAYDTVYMVKNQWLDTFPDTIVQYGHVWIRSGAEVNLTPFEMAPYRKN